MLSLTALYNYTRRSTNRALCDSGKTTKKGTQYFSLHYCFVRTCNPLALRAAPAGLEGSFRTPPPPNQAFAFVAHWV